MCVGGGYGRTSCDSWKTRSSETKTWGGALPNEPVVAFLSYDEAVAIHEVLIARFGGPTGIRDPGLLESALYRPQTGYYQDVLEMATALFESVLMNHPFVDGNKRAAFFCVDVFLRMNGWKIDVKPEPAHAMIIGLLERHEADFEHLHSWLKESVIAR